jgi:hypothetical protein
MVSSRLAAAELTCTGGPSALPDAVRSAAVPWATCSRHAWNTTGVNPFRCPFTVRSLLHGLRHPLISTIGVAHFPANRCHIPALPARPPGSPPVAVPGVIVHPALG